jgi:hypothetical protein
VWWLHSRTHTLVPRSSQRQFQDIVDSGASMRSSLRMGSSPAITRPVPKAHRVPLPDRREAAYCDLRQVGAIQMYIPCPHVQPRCQSDLPTDVGNSAQVFESFPSSLRPAQLPQSHGPLVERVSPPEPLLCQKNVKQTRRTRAKSHSGGEWGGDHAGLLSAAARCQ